MFKSCFVAREKILYFYLHFNLSTAFTWLASLSKHQVFNFKRCVEAKIHPKHDLQMFLHLLVRIIHKVAQF